MKLSLKVFSLITRFALLLTYRVEFSRQGTVYGPKLLDRKTLKVLVNIFSLPVALHSGFQKLSNLRALEARAEANKWKPISASALKPARLGHFSSWIFITRLFSIRPQNDHELCTLLHYSQPTSSIIHNNVLIQTLSGRQIEPNPFAKSTSMRNAN